MAATVAAWPGPAQAWGDLAQAVRQPSRYATTAARGLAPPSLSLAAWGIQAGTETVVG